MTGEDIKKLGIEKWNETFEMFTNPPTKGMRNLGIDLIIFGKMNDTLADDVFGSGTLRYMDHEHNRPIAGVLTINSKIDLSRIN